MLYVKLYGDTEISRLGLGTMRLPVVDGDYSKIDQAETDRMVDRAMENGVNYFDTAWGYHDGNAELAIGKSLKRYPRESFFLADKFPGYDLSNMGKIREIFPAQLEKCQADYFDFYLFHNVCEMNIDAYLDEKYGILSYLLQQKAAGKIRHLGFSAHGGLEVMKRFLEAYGDQMEFCQIQLNYMDWEFQDAKAKLALLKEYRLPVWVMEPLRGGQLASLQAEDAKKLYSLRPEGSIPAWAFRFLQTIPEVAVTLSGMSNLAQVEENIRTFSEEKPLAPTEWEALLGIAGEMVRKTALPCTGCRYCTSHCPQGLNIPWLLELYNEHVVTGGGFIAPMALASLPEDKQPSACIGCRSCEAVCPQQLRISEAMADFVGKLKT